MNFRRLFAGAAATLTLMEKRAATALLIMLLTTATAWAWGGTYIGEDGVQHDLNLEGIDASPIEDNGDGISNLDPNYGWYYVKGNVTINSLSGNAAGGEIHIILCDGATLTITNEDGMAISLNHCNLYIYGQSAGTGKLIATSTGGSGINTNGCSLTIAGGIVTATSTGGSGIETVGGDLTIAGGYLKATSISVGGGSITLAGGAVKASSYGASNEITIDDDLTYYDGKGESYESAIDLNAADVNDRILSTYEHLSGTCGNGVTWSGDLESLTISGTGAMYDYGGDDQPWKDFKQFITSVTIGDGVTSIGDGAFEECTSLTSVVIPDGVTRIGGGAFDGCTSLAIVSGASGVTFIGPSAFTDTDWYCNLPSGLTTLGHVAYRFVGNGTSVTIPDGTTQIYQSAFQNSAITSIVIPASVTSIGIYAFYFSALQRVYSLRPEAPELGYNAFGHCNSLGAIVVPAAAYDSYYSGWSSYSSNLQSGYTVTCGAGVTATTYAPIVADGETVTLGHNRTGYDFGGYESSDVTITDGTFTMPARDVTVSAAWTPSDNIALTANLADGNYWTTFYCGDADYTVATEGAYAYTAEVGTDAVTLTKRGTDIPMGKAVIIVGGGNGTDASVSISLTKTSGLAAYDGTNHLHGVDVRTEKSTLGSGTFYVMGKQNGEFGFYEYTGQYMPARKAYFTVPATAGAHKFTMVFGDETGVTPLLSPEGEEGASPWYTLSGTRLNGKPATKGVYISNGRKIVIK